jgi:hypothetical protein
MMHWPFYNWRPPHGSQSGVKGKELGQALRVTDGDIQAQNRSVTPADDRSLRIFK